MVVMCDVQIVDGKTVGIGEVVTSDATTEAALVAHGKASYVKETVEAAVEEAPKKGGK